MIGLDIKGYGVLTRKLGKVRARQTLVKPMKQATMYVLNDAARYPPKRPGSRYRRQGTLGRRWTTRLRIYRNPHMVVGHVSNRTSYGKYVMGHGSQAWMHRGYWRTEKQILSRNRRAISAFFRHAYMEAINS